MQETRRSCLSSYGRRLADAEVVFTVSYEVKCATADCAGEADAAEERLVATTADTAAFTAQLKEAMEETAAELMESGEITTEEATAATTISITVEAVVVEEAVVETVVNEDYVAPVVEEEIETDDKTGDVLDADGSAGALRLSAIVGVAGLVGAALI